jgi:hypothetical protein
VWVILVILEFRQHARQDLQAQILFVPPLSLKKQLEKQERELNDRRSRL